MRQKSKSRPAASVAMGSANGVTGAAYVLDKSGPIAVRAVLIKSPIMVPKAFQAGYPSSTGFRKVVKATIHVKKKEGMSDEDFIEYYNTKHAQKAVPILQRHGILSYSLVFPPLLHLKRRQYRAAADVSQTYHLERDRKMIQDIMHGKAQLMDYDAICTFVFPDYLALAKFLYDKDGAALSDDHENFMDDSVMKMMVGDEYMLIQDGEKVG
jgi:hypothetical protein